MAVITQKGSFPSHTSRLEVLVNYCRTVVRGEDEHLRLAMGQYQEFLASQQRN